MGFPKLARFAAISLLLLGVTDQAETISLPLTDDAWINANSPETNRGLVENIFVHNYGPKYGLVRFDTASVAGQHVNSATLALHLSSISRDGSISIYLITTAWNEATVTWNNLPSIEASPIAEYALTTGDAGSVVAVDVTAAVQRWADGSVPDAGFMLVTSDGIKAYFDSKEMTGGVPATLEVETGVSINDGRAIVLDFTDAENCTIDEPGYYILDRSWDFSAPNPQGACSHITAAENVIIDLQGFTLTFDPNSFGGLDTCGTIRGGRLIQAGPWGNVLSSDFCGPTVTDVDLEGTIYVNSGQFWNVRIKGQLKFTGVWGNDRHPGDVAVRDSTIWCVKGCLSVSNATSLEIRNNSIIAVQPDSVMASTAISLALEDDSQVSGAKIIEGNLIEMSGPSVSPRVGIDLRKNWGDRTIVARNLIRIDGVSSVGMQVSGDSEYSYVIDGNFVMGSAVGLEFVEGATGNYFGNNRVSATTPFIGLGSQIDWGGNVSF